MTDQQDRNTIVEKRTCVEPGCGATFGITKGNKEFFESKGMILPKRCEKCRLKRRATIQGSMQIPLK